MFLINKTGSYIYLKGFTLIPDETLEIQNNIYYGNEDLKNQIDNLYLNGELQVSGFEDDLPVSGNNEKSLQVFPVTFDVTEEDLIINKNNAYVGITINKNDNDTYYGSIEMFSSLNNHVLVSADNDEKSDGLIHIDKRYSVTQKHFDIRNDGFKITLNPATVSAEDLANFLIDIGLAELA